MKKGARPGGGLASTPAPPRGRIPCRRPRRVDMPDEPTPSPPTLAQLSHMLRQYLASLEAAGVQWLPASRVPLPLFIAADAPVASPAAVEHTDSPEARR